MSSSLRRLCVFCGSHSGTENIYRVMATKVGRLLAEREIGLVFGGGQVGMMGHLARATLAAGGHATGVITRALIQKEGPYEEHARLQVVTTMHQRKQTMAKLSDAFLVLPGGFGSLEELFEILTLAQLNLHRKPCGLLNVRGYFDLLLEFLDHCVSQGFLPLADRRLLIVGSNPRKLLDEIEKRTAKTAASNKH
jgi:uncharacterized protein (TIGR00730 family)